MPNAHLRPSGPPIVLELRRDHQPALELWKRALRQPKGLKPKKRKNIATTDLGDTVGRIHLGVQKTDELQTRKVKALRKGAGDDATSGGGGDGSGDSGDDE